MEHILEAFDFWVSGVVLLAVGLAGIIGNLVWISATIRFAVPRKKLDRLKDQGYVVDIDLE